jgi:hypothetical protein
LFRKTVRGGRFDVGSADIQSQYLHDGIYSLSEGCSQTPRDESGGSGTAVKDSGRSVYSVQTACSRQSNRCSNAGQQILQIGDVCGVSGTGTGRNCRFDLLFLRAGCRRRLSGGGIFQLGRFCGQRRC